MQEPAIRVEGLSKVYKLYDKPVDRLKESINPFRRKYHRDFYALRNVSFEIKKGETVGIIGKNGSGKSTLLKIITGVLTQSEGSVSVNGKVSALLELGAGFNPELTGIENIYLNGTIMGYAKEETDAKLKDILEFADIGDFAYQPVKTYSSGMFVRLAFASAISVEPDILIVDEALAVGDIRFQQKCLRKIEEFKKSKTVIFVSHSLSDINRLCERVIWLDQGEIVNIGDPYEVSKEYQAFMNDSDFHKEYTLNKPNTVNSNNDISGQERSFNIDEIGKDVDVIGDLKAEITGVSILDCKTDEKINILKPGQRIKILIRVKYNETIKDPIVGFSIRNNKGLIVTETNNYVLNNILDEVKNPCIKVYCFELDFPNLYDGEYTLSVAIASGTQIEHKQHCYTHDVLIFSVISGLRHSLQGAFFIDKVLFSTL
ncbi:MAG: ABC transporter ATP-binding protein [Bacillota bacterium]